MCLKVERREVVEVRVFEGSVESCCELSMEPAERKFIFPQRMSKYQKRDVHNDLSGLSYLVERQTLIWGKNY